MQQCSTLLQKVKEDIVCTIPVPKNTNIDCFTHRVSNIDEYFSLVYWTLTILFKLRRIVHCTPQIDRRGEQGISRLSLYLDPTHDGAVLKCSSQPAHPRLKPLTDARTLQVICTYTQRTDRNKCM